MLVAMFFGTLMNITTRMLEVEGNNGKGLHPFQILFARMSITVVLASAYMWWTKTPHFPLGAPEVRSLLVARGLGGFFGVFGMYYSLLYLPMADATVITFLAPSLSCWACSFLINEPFTRIEKIGSLVAFVGVIFIARPTSLFAGAGTDAPPAGSTGDMVPGVPVNGTSSSPGIPDASNYDNVTPAQRLAAVGLALVGVFGSVCAFTTIRWIGRRAHPLISTNYFAVWCTIVSTVAQLTLPGVGFLLPASAREWGMLIFLGICGFTMQFLLAAGLSYEKSSRATNMTYTSMLYALTFDKLVFGQTPGSMSIIGSTLILGSAIYMAVHRDSSADPGPSKESDEGGDTSDGLAGHSNREGLEGTDEEGVRLMGAMEDGQAGRKSFDEDVVELRSLG
ncbi:hypothetical protein AAFC00_004503 [Neodothiora populina]|uniref:EamA domain-containing protein n=1 Tax=Neodothiora populina TaxID=2781224 RepID=A0ABR3P3L4_9PEZI